MPTPGPHPAVADQRSDQLGDFLEFLLAARTTLKTNLAAKTDERVEQIRSPLEEHYLDDRGQPAMYQRLESALYDDSRQIVTLWNFFDSCDRQQLRRYRSLVHLERDGLTGDRHPRKVFDRSPFGIAAIVVMTVTVWMTVIKTFTGEDVSELLALIHFNWVAGVIWIVGLFVVLWFILKTMRNNRQVAFLASLDRALALYLDEDFGQQRHRRAA